MLVFVAVIFMINAVQAEIIIIDNFQSTYHLGESIRSNALIDSSEDRYVILGASLSCGSFKINFFKSAENLIKNQNKTVDLSSVPVNRKMLGICNLMVNVEDFEGGVIEEEKSRNFIITDSLDVNISLDKKEYLPGEFIIATGFLNESDSYNISIFVNNKLVTNRSFNGKDFVEKLETNKSYKGVLEVEIIVEDGFGNRGVKKASGFVMSIPTSLDVSGVNGSIMPGEFIVVKSAVYDQAGDFTGGDIVGTVNGPDNSVVDQFNFSSGEQYVFQTGKLTPAGKYTIDVTSGELESYANFVVAEVKDAEIGVSEGKLYVGNIGNVIYSQRGFVEAQAGDLVYQIPVAFDLGIGGKVEIDLAKELPGQVYNISLEGNNKTFTFNNSYIEDQRVLTKKISQGVSRITGNSVIETDNQKNFFFVVMIALILLGGLIYFANNKMKLRTIGEFKEKVNVQDQHIEGLNKDLVQEKEKSMKIKELFAQYVDTDVLEQHEETQRRGTEKKEISVLFTDIRGFSALFGKLDDLEITEMLNPYFKRSHEIIARHGGMVNKFIGDSVMALFNAPRVQPDHLMKAVKAGLDIQREIEKLNVQLKGKGVAPIKVGIGIDFGSAAVGHLGGAGKIEYTAIGMPVNLASRLQSVAVGGQILVKKDVYERIKDKVIAEPIGKRQFKNISGEFEIYSVKALKEDANRFRGFNREERKV